jgi:hypothetical protein
MNGFSKTHLKQRWWMHRDQKINDRKNERSYQSSLYLTQSTKASEDGFICCIGSHLWSDGEGWEVSADRNHVSVPSDDKRIPDAIIKIIVQPGQMIVWDSRIAHMGGFTSKISNSSSMIKVPMVQLTPLESTDDSGIRERIQKDGVCLVNNIACETEMSMIREQLRLDIADVYDIPLCDDWTKYPVECYGRANKGGGSWGPIACTKAAWLARLLPKRIQVFQGLLRCTDIVVSIDSVHWSIEHPRLSFMASFCPRELRSDEAYKRKVLSQAYGLTRTTHWANNGDISIFNYGGERNSAPQKRFESVSLKWNGYGSNNINNSTIRNVYVKQLSKAIEKEALTMSMVEVNDFLIPEVSRWL